MLKSSRDEDGFVREKIGSLYLFVYLLTRPPGLLLKMNAHWRHSGIFQVQSGHLKHH